MSFDGAILKREDAGGPLPLLLAISGFAAMERDSELIDLADLLKAIYVVDLEHISMFWHDWQDFEKLVARGAYINRVLYLLQYQLAVQQQESGFFAVGHPSRALVESIAKARQLSDERDKNTPTTADLLFAACLADTDISARLQESGLQLSKLESAVRNRHS